jgi:serine/threonine protein kinase
VGERKHAIQQEQQAGPTRAGFAARALGPTANRTSGVEAATDTGAHVGDLLVGKYLVEREIARGGMGVVVAARHLELDEPVAIKLILPEHLSDPIMVERFMREARAAARIKSEHVVRVFDVGKLPTGQPYMVMELLHGEDLDERLRRRGPLPVAEVIEHARECLAALGKAHAAGVIHRDLKPANLFLAEQHDGARRLKVLDFGISKLTSKSPSPVKTQGLLGSPPYMSPEQLGTELEVDARADIWALGVSLYELLTGRHPFEGDAIPQIVHRIIHEEPRPLRSFRPEVPASLEAVVLRCLEKQREDRYSDAASVTSALDHLDAAGAPASLRSIERAFPNLPRITLFSDDDLHLRPSAPSIPAVAVSVTASVPPASERGRTLTSELPRIPTANLIEEPDGNLTPGSDSGRATASAASARTRRGRSFVASVGAAMVALAIGWVGVFGASQLAPRAKASVRAATVAWALGHAATSRATHRIIVVPTASLRPAPASASASASADSSAPTPTIKE